MVTSELQGLSAAGVYGTVKHFPGHGSTSGDSHDGAVSTDKTLEELMAEELVPFQSAIDGGVNFVMVGHISAPECDRRQCAGYAVEGDDYRCASRTDGI